MPPIRWVRHFKLGVKSLLLHKMRSLLTMLGVVFGVGSVVAMLSIGEGASRSTLAEIEKLGAHNVIIRSVKPPEDNEGGLEEGRSRTSAYGLLYEDAERMRTYPAVARLAPAKIKRDRARLDSKDTSVRLIGTTPEWFELVPRALVAGRTLDERDIWDHECVCVLSEPVARTLLPDASAVGQTIKIAGESYTVIGIVEAESGGSGIQLPDDPRDVYIPLNVMKERIGDTTTQRAAGTRIRETVELHQIVVQIGPTHYRTLSVESIDNVEPTARAIEAGLSLFHKKLDYDVSVPLALLRQARETQRIFSIVLGSIAGISLLVGGIGIMNIMLASVTERTREIGVRRAIGAKRKQIIGQFLIETMTLSACGGLVGVALGFIIPAIIEHFASMPTIVTPWSVLLALGISVTVGVIFGLYPAYRAAMLDPITALRHE